MDLYNESPWRHIIGALKEQIKSSTDDTNKNALLDECDQKICEEAREVIQNAGGNTKAISALLFSDYLLPFELTSILILVGIVGSVAIAMRRRRPE